MAFSRTALVLAVALAACGQGRVRVDASGTAQDMRFTVQTAKKDDACVDRLSVTPLKPENADPVWQVTAVDPSRCSATLRYGDQTDHFAEVAPAKPIRPGISYRVRASGAGFNVVRDFHVAPGGVVVQN